MARSTHAKSLNLDSPFERLTALARAMFGAPHGMIGVVIGDRTVFRASTDLGSTELPREVSVTGLVAGLGPDAVLIIEDAFEDERVRHHPMVVGGPRLRFFAGASVSNAAGEAVGAIGVMDVKPRAPLSEAEVENLRVLARMAGDIVERAEASRIQAEKLELLRLAEEMAGVGQWRLDAASMRVTWSDEVYRIHGVERAGFDPSCDDAIGYYHPDDQGPLRAAVMHALETGEGYKLRLRIIRPDTGAERLVLAHADTDRDTAGRVLSVFGVFQDVTEQEETRRRLIEARDRAEAGARAKSEFLANMSHELRTPLTSVIGFSGLLKASAALPDAERRYADRIATASDALLGVINDILDYSKLEAEAVTLEPRGFDPRAMVEAAAAIVEGQCLGKGLGLKVVLDPGAPPAVTGDEGRLRQVTLNFLSNAVKFTAAGEVRLVMGWRDGALRISVADTGIGISPDKIDTVFERFSQADSSTTRVYGGTGLGLTISRRLIEMMGGAVGVESREGVGSTFWFEVPLAAAAEAADAAEAAVGPSPEGLRILMADDAPANRELVAAILGGMGVALHAVPDGAQAVEAAREGGFDLILMDVHMPVLDGLDATRAIRALEGEAGRVPIIALTANVQPEQVERCRQAGMDDHVGKPIEVTQLLRVMAALLEAGPDAQARRKTA